MLIKKKKIFFITTFIIIIAAIAVVLFVGYFTGEKKIDYEGTLVEEQTDYRC